MTLNACTSCFHCFTYCNYKFMCARDGTQGLSGLPARQASTLSTEPHPQSLANCLLKKFRRLSFSTYSAILGVDNFQCIHSKRGRVEPHCGFQLHFSSIYCCAWVSWKPLVPMLYLLFSFYKFWVVLSQRSIQSLVFQPLNENPLNMCQPLHYF